ncbi:hypothetical protein ACTXT7_010124 [Hymenolepis weldensis]
MAKSYDLYHGVGLNKRRNRSNSINIRETLGSLERYTVRSKAIISAALYALNDTIVDIITHDKIISLLEIS